MILPRLTDREVEVMAAVAQGEDDLVIAEALQVPETTVRQHLRNIIEKLDLRLQITDTRSEN